MGGLGYWSPTTRADGASVSFAITRLAAKGDTTLYRVYYLDRRYERLEEELAACGADIECLKV